MHIRTDNVNTAFYTLVRGMDGKDDIEFSTVKMASRNGPVIMVPEPVTITYKKPVQRVLFNRARDCNPFFHVYEALWMLAGRNDLAPLAYYNSKMADYSDDGKTVTGSAYGYRWRHAKGYSAAKYDIHDQLKKVIKHLKGSPDSRRAVIQMWNVEDDLLKIGDPVVHPDLGTVDYENYSKDVACNLCIILMLRDGDRIEDDSKWHSHTGTFYKLQKLLDMTVVNRSNDMVWGMLGANVVHFSFLQEYLAAHIGCEVGNYHQISNNMHVYEWNWKPDEWLAEYKKSSVVDPYRVPSIMTGLVPLVDKPLMFDAQVQHFCDAYDGTPDNDVCDQYTERFLETVAKPMCEAFKMHKKRNYDAADYWIQKVAAADWRMAGQQWLAERHRNYVSKNLGAHQGS